MKRGFLPSCALLLGLSLASATQGWAATPEERKACNEAYADAQTLRDAHQLTEARKQLRICSQPVCKDFIVKDCTTWLADVQARMASVAISAKDRSGQALIEVTVWLDGKPFATRLEGTSIDVDPGPHVFSFQTADGAKAEQTVLVLEGQKAQLIAVTIQTGSAPAPAPTPPSAPTPPPAATPPPASPPPAASPASPIASGVTATRVAPSFWTTQREIGATTAGLGVAGVAIGGVLGLLAISAANQQNADCASLTNCPNRAGAVTDHSTATNDGTIATVGVIGGGVLLATGAVLILTGAPDSGEATRGPTAVSLIPQLGPDRAGLLLTGGF